MLDLDRETLDALVARAAASAVAELDATRRGPVLASPPSASALHARLHRARPPGGGAPAPPPSASGRHAGLDGPLPVEGEPLDEVLAACDAVLAAGRRTAPAF